MPRQYRLAQIFVAGGADDAAHKAESSKIAEIKSKLDRPSADFAGIAAETSDQKETAAQDGELGWVPENQVRPEILSQIAGLGHGEISEPPAAPVQPQLQRPDLIADTTIESLRDLVQGSGYRVEIVRDGNLSFLRSATSGLAFDIRPGNAAQNVTTRYADLAFIGFFDVRGTLPLDLLNRWNGTRRFGRLSRSGDGRPAVPSVLLRCIDGRRRQPEPSARRSRHLG